MIPVRRSLPLFGGIGADACLLFKTRDSALENAQRLQQLVKPAVHIHHASSRAVALAWRPACLAARMAHPIRAWAVRHLTTLSPFAFDCLVCAARVGRWSRHSCLLRHGCGGIAAVLAGIRVTDRGAGRLPPVHPATAVRHRGLRCIDNGAAVLLCLGLFLRF